MGQLIFTTRNCVSLISHRSRFVSFRGPRIDPRQWQQLVNANFPRWRPFQPPKQIFVCRSSQVSYTKTNKKSISIVSMIDFLILDTIESIVLRSGYRSLVVAIAWKCNIQRWRPIWLIKQIFVYLSSQVSYKDKIRSRFL